MALRVGPGGFAKSEHERLRRRWRHRLRWPARAALVVAFTSGALGLHLIGPVGPAKWTGVALIVVSTFAAVAFAEMRDGVPDWIDNWRLGAEGEVATARVLRQLPAGWRTAHDVTDIPELSGNIDHIVCGPAGMFVIDTKKWAGQEAGVWHGELHVTRLLNAERPGRGVRPIGAVKRQAFLLHQLLLNRTGVKRFVTPVIAVWAAESSALPAEVDGVWVVPGEELAQWLLARPKVMVPVEADRLWAAVPAHV